MKRKEVIFLVVFITGIIYGVYLCGYEAGVRYALKVEHAVTWLEPKNDN